LNKRYFVLSLLGFDAFVPTFGLLKLDGLDCHLMFSMLVNTLF